jgi:hypothetical protein
VIVVKKIIKPRGIPETNGTIFTGCGYHGREACFISGQVPEDARGDLVGKGDIEAQTRQVLTNLKTMVEDSGGTIADIVKIRVFHGRDCSVLLRDSSQTVTGVLRGRLHCQYDGGSKAPGLARLAD